MPLVVRAFPLRRSVSDLQAFAAELNGAKAADATQFYRHYGVDHESWHVQQTPNGPWVIAVTALGILLKRRVVTLTQRKPFTSGSRTRSYLLLGSIRIKHLLALQLPRSFPGQAPRLSSINWSLVPPNLSLNPDASPAALAR